MLTLDEPALGVARRQSDASSGPAFPAWNEFNAYALALAGLLLARGRLANALGSRRIFLVGLPAS